MCKVARVSPNTALWERLPEDAEVLILNALVRQLSTNLRVGCKTSREAAYCAREINWAFRRAVGHLWRLFTPKVWVQAPMSGFQFTSRWTMRADAVPSFVEGVMRYYCNYVVDDGRYAINSDTYSSLYSLIYDACVTRQPVGGGLSKTLSEPYYDALQSVGRALVENGALRGLKSAKQRARWVLIVSHIFKFLDRNYVPRYELPHVENVLNGLFNVT